MNGWYVESIEGGGTAPPGSPVDLLMKELDHRAKLESDAVRSGKSRRAARAEAAEAADLTVSA